MIDLTFLYSMDEPCILVPFPCGCVVEANAKCRDGVFECRWCGATFDDRSLTEWINGDAPPEIYLERGPRTMLRWQEHLFEVYGEKFGLPLVRFGEQFVVVPQQDVEWVQN